MTLEEAETLALSTLKQVMEEKVITAITNLDIWMHFVVLICICSVGPLSRFYLIVLLQSSRYPRDGFGMSRVIPESWHLSKTVVWHSR